MKQAHWRVFTALLVVLGISLGSLGLWSLTAASAENEATSRASRSGAKESDTLDRKLKQILENQEKILENQAAILQKFDLVMEELRIIKVRALINN